MSGLVHLLAEAKAAGIRFKVMAPGELEMTARQAPPPDLVARLKAAKPALLCMLGGLPVEIPAEWRIGVQRLHSAPCPSGIPAARWASLGSDSMLFVTSSFAAQAAALGWSTADLWGCHPRRPLVRLDCRGALWGVDRAEIVALTGEEIVVRGERGARLVWRRPRPGPGVPVVLAWQLAAKTEVEPTNAA